MESKSGFLRPDTPLPVNTNGKQKSPSTNELLVASRKGHASEVKKILAEGGGSAATNLDKHGRNCLHLACHYGRLETVQAILSFENIDINSISKRGFTPLHEASGEGHLSVVFLLLAKGAFLRARSKEGWTALMSASYNGHNDVARVLIAAGLDVNATNKNGFTALHVAAWRGNTKIVEMLLKEGALITLETTSKKSALDIAREENQFEVITILQAASTKDSEQPFYRIASLEAQLKVAHEKLMQTQEKHDKILKAEREQMAKHYDDMKKKLLQDLAVTNGSDSSYSGSENEIGNDAFVQLSDIPVIITSIESPNTATSKKIKPVISVLKEKRDQVPTMASPLVNRRAYKPSVPKLQPRIKNDTKVLDSLCLDPIQEYTSTDDGIKTRRSLDGLTAVPKLNGVDKLTITQLVENSKQGPSTIASIRKQLKEDGLTPKIKKKFEKQELPAVSHHSEKPYAPLEGQTRMQTEQ